jgi:hypothetical protein
VKLTQHAEKRSQQRGFSKQGIDIILNKENIRDVHK